MAKMIRSIYTFYLSHFFVGILLSSCCAYLYRIYGPKTFVFLFWFKLFTMAIIWYTVNKYKRKEFFYYQNLGISKALLFTVTLGLDFILFVALLIFSAQMR